MTALRSRFFATLVALAALACLAQASLRVIDTYPQPDFMRNFHPSDPLTRARCIENGLTGLAQGRSSSRQGGIYVQRCYGSWIEWQEIDYPQARIGQLGVQRHSMVDLGTKADLWAKYGAEGTTPSVDMYLTLKFQLDPQAPFLIGDRRGEDSNSVHWTPLLLEDWEGLNKTASLPNPELKDGHIYLGRITNEQQTKIDFEGKHEVMFVKIHVVDLARRVLRWSVLAHDSRIEVVYGDAVSGDSDHSLQNDGSSSSDEAKMALAVGIVAMALSLIGIVLAVVLIRKMKSMGQAAILAASINRYQESPDYWQQS